MGDINQNTDQATNNENSSIDLSEYPIYSDLIRSVLTVLRHIWIVIPVFVLGSGATYLFLQQQPKVYESEATVIINPQINPGDDDILRVIDTMRYNIVGTYVELLRSRTSLENAYDALNDIYDEDVLKDAIIDIRPVENSSVISISVRASDPDVARDLADEIIAQTIRNNIALGQLSEFYPIQILDSASHSDNPVAPDTRLSLIIGCVASLGLGVGLAFAYESFLMARGTKKQDDEVNSKQ